MATGPSGIYTRANGNYGDLMKVYGRGISHLVRTKSEYIASLERAWNENDSPHLIHAKLKENDASQTLRKLAERLSKSVG